MEYVSEEWFQSDFKSALKPTTHSYLSMAVRRCTINQNSVWGFCVTTIEQVKHTKGLSTLINQRGISIFSAHGSCTCSWHIFETALSKLIVDIPATFRTACQPRHDFIPRTIFIDWVPQRLH